MFGEATSANTARFVSDDDLNLVLLQLLEYLGSTSSLVSECALNEVSPDG
jgi:hypothetical protein